MKKWIIGALASVFITGGFLVAFRDHAVRVWAAPDKIDSVEKATVENTLIQKQLTDITQRQQTQIELQDKELAHQKEIRETEKEFYLELIKKVNDK